MFRILTKESRAVSRGWCGGSSGWVGLSNALTLYEQWEETHRKVPTKGSFAIDPHSGSLIVSRNCPEVEENVYLSHVIQGRWKNESARIVTANRLYAWSDVSDKAAYILSAIALPS